MRLAIRSILVWGVHHSQHVRGVTKRTTLMTVSACARLSRRLPARIVCCSEQARSEYARRGFAASAGVALATHPAELVADTGQVEVARMRGQ